VRRLLLLVALLAAGTLLWVALRGRPEPPARLRLAPHENALAVLVDGELVRTTVVVDTGTPRGQAHTLEIDRHDGAAIAGFLTQPDGQPPYAWAVGRAVGVTLDVLQPEERELLVEVANGTDGPQTVELLFNGAPLATQGLPGPENLFSITVPVPAALQRRGANLVELRFSATQSRRLLGQDRDLPLAAVVRHITFTRPGQTRVRPPDPPERAGVLELRRDGQVLNELSLPSDCLARAPLRLPDAPRVALRVWLDQVDVPFELGLQLDDRRERLRLLPAGTRPCELELDLTPWAGRAAVLELQALGERDALPAAVRVGAIQLLVPEDWAALQAAERAARAAPAPAAVPAGRPSFLVVVLDAFAGRYVNRELDGRLLTPTLASLAASGLLFPDAQAPASYTLASVGALLTGQEPLTHGLVSTLDAQGDFTRLAPDAPRLAAELSAHGWLTAAFVTNPNAGAHHGFAAGFARFDALYADEALRRPGRGVHGGVLPERLADFLAQAGEQPFLAWVHVFEPHAPYESPADLRERFVQPYDGPVQGTYEWIEAFRSGAIGCDEAGWRHLRELYAARTAFSDLILGQLLERLMQSGRASDTVVVVLGDHGESLGERGIIEHGDAAPREQLDVPLLIAGPPALGLGRGLRPGPAALQDVAPTLLRLAGLRPPAAMQGRDLLAGALDPGRPLAALSSVWLPQLSWRSGRHRLVVDLLTRRVRLFDRVADPEETRDLAEALPATRALLLRELCAHVAAAETERAGRAAESGAGEAADERTLEMLQQIGYAAAVADGRVEGEPLRITAQLRRLLRRL
jgi:arylsulfatase A-like enzyme